VYSEEGGLGMGEEESEEDLQFQLSERIDQLGDKSSRTRLEALTFINKVLCQKIVLQHLIGTYVPALCYELILLINWVAIM